MMNDEQNEKSAIILTENLSHSFRTPHSAFRISPDRRRTLILLIHFAYFLVGAGTILLGVILPSVARQLNFDDSQSGTLSTAQYLGSIAGTLLTSILWRKFGFVRILIAGLLSMAAGIGGLAFGEFWQIVAFFVLVNGFGIGIVLPTTNILIARLADPQNTAASLNIVNFAWGTGALACPVFFGRLGMAENVDFPLILLATAIFVAAICIVPLINYGEAKKPAVISAKNNSDKLWRTPFAVCVAVLLFLYVGAENSLGYWLTSFALRFENSADSLSTIVTAAFWTAFLLGRLSAPLWLKVWRETTFLLFSLVCAAIGMTLLIAAGNSFWLNAGAIFAGFGFAPVFPTAFALFTKRFGERAESESKWIFVTATFGGALMTWMIGFLSKTLGDLRFGFAVTLAACLLMIFLSVLLMRETKRFQTEN